MDIEKWVQDQKMSGCRYWFKFWDGMNHEFESTVFSCSSGQVRKNDEKLTHRERGESNQKWCDVHEIPWLLMSNGRIKVFVVLMDQFMEWDVRVAHGIQWVELVCMKCILYTRVDYNFKIDEPNNQNHSIGWHWDWWPWIHQLRRRLRWYPRWV